MSARTDSKTLAEVRSPRRKPESLAKIKKAARKVFVKRGYHATRPQDIGGCQFGVGVQTAASADTA